MNGNNRGGCEPEHYGLPGDPAIGRGYNTCSHLYAALSSIRYQAQPGDFFTERDHTQPCVGRGGKEFISRFNTSEWSEDFLHGADMFPAMVEWFSTYLAKQGRKFGDFINVKFRNETIGNLIFNIETQKDKVQERTSSVHGEFTDNADGHYYFYTILSPFEAFSLPYRVNTIPDHLLVGESVGPITSRIALKNKCVNYNYGDVFKLIALAEQYREHIPYYKGIMENNEWFVRSTITDILNTICVYKDKKGGKIVSYDKLTLLSDFSLDDFFLGTYGIRISLVGEPRKIWTESVLSVRSFELLYDKKIVVKGEFTSVQSID